MTPEGLKGSPIRPEQIDASKHLYDAFGHTETEVSAGYIIRMLQEKGDWLPFSQEEIEEFYRRSGHTDGFTFNALINPVTERLFDGRLSTVGGGFVFQRPDGKFEVTREFVERAYISSPRS